MNTPYSVKSVPPVYGFNYDLGYSGFVFDDDSLLSHGIAWFERWEDMRAVKVSHALTVTGFNQCIEALDNGVVRSSLSKYFDDPTKHIMFRKPRYYSTNMARVVVDACVCLLGCPYDNGTIWAQLLNHTYAGRFLSWLSRGWTEKQIANLCHQKGHFICSAVNCYSLNQTKELRNVGSLKQAPYLISPKHLFLDDEIYVQLKNKRVSNIELKLGSAEIAGLAGAVA